jgi:lipase maturation factor 1
MPLWIFESQPVGPDTYAWATWIFLRLLGGVYLIAFLSLARQIHGLIGSQGLWPIGRDFPAEARYAPLRAFLRRPTIFLWDTSDRALTVACGLGIVLSLLLIAGVAPLPMLAALWLLYLSLVHACGVFLGFQWDILLLETGVVAMLIAPLELLPVFPPAATPAPVARWVVLWLLFRLVFSSGIVKLRSGDRTWRNLTAMNYHYMTQPIPNRPAWYMHRMPGWFHRGETAAMFFIELVVPFGLFAPAPVCYISAALIAALMLLIFVTGNYTFFNILTLALCVMVFDDRAVLTILGTLAEGAELPAAATVPPVAWQSIVTVLGVLLALLSVDVLARLFTRKVFPWPPFVRPGLDRLRPFLLVNNYGLFANMTTRRPEIIVEGSEDGQIWKPYEFKWKPGDLRLPPRQVAPHQPRLDWQMWFAALGSYRSNPWFINLLGRLLENSPPVVALLRHNAFNDKPPKLIRALLYDYDFTTLAERRRTGAWWKRSFVALYCPVLMEGARPYPYYIPPPATR